MDGEKAATSEVKFIKMNLTWIYFLSPFFFLCVVQIFDNWVQPGDSFVGLFMKAEPGGRQGG